MIAEGCESHCFNQAWIRRVRGAGECFLGIKVASEFLGERKNVQERWAVQAQRKYVIQTNWSGILNSDTKEYADDDDDEDARTHSNWNTHNTNCKKLQWH